MESDEYLIKDEISELRLKRKKLKERRMNATKEYFKKVLLQKCNVALLLFNSQEPDKIRAYIESFVNNISYFKCSYIENLEYRWSKEIHITLSTTMCFTFQVSLCPPFDLYFKGGHRPSFFDPSNYGEFSVRPLNYWTKNVMEKFDELSEHEKKCFYESMCIIKKNIFECDVLDKTKNFFETALNTRYFEDRYNVFLIIHDRKLNPKSIFSQLPHEIMLIVFKHVLNMNDKSARQSGEVRFVKKCKC